MVLQLSSLLLFAGLNLALGVATHREIAGQRAHDEAGEGGASTLFGRHQKAPGGDGQEEAAHAAGYPDVHTTHGTLCQSGFVGLSVLPAPEVVVDEVAQDAAQRNEAQCGRDVFEVDHCLSLCLAHDDCALFGCSWISCASYTC